MPITVNPTGMGNKISPVNPISVENGHIQVRSNSKAAGQKVNFGLENDIVIKYNEMVVSTVPKNNKTRAKNSSNSTLLKVLGTLAAAVGVAAMIPKARFSFRNLFGEKGLDKFMKSGKPAFAKAKEVLGSVSEKVPGLKSAVENMSSWNLLRLAKNIAKGGKEQFIDILSGKIKISEIAEAPQKVFDIATADAYKLYREVKWHGTLANALRSAEAAAEPGEKFVGMIYRAGESSKILYKSAKGLITKTGDWITPRAVIGSRISSDYSNGVRMIGDDSAFLNIYKKFGENHSEIADKFAKLAAGEAI